MEPHVSSRRLPYKFIFGDSSCDEAEANPVAVSRAEQVVKMKLNIKAIRYLSADDWRVLTAVEMGSKNHEIVPTPLIGQIAGLRGGSGVHKSISSLAKENLIAKVKNAKYDGYRLTYGGIDYLALNAHRKASTLFSLGNQIGVGKESDIYAVATDSGRQLVLKIHRLGRISFRTVKANRDYLRNRAGGSWMYLSRLAATKEYAFLQALWKEGFPVPEPIGHNRHTVVMDLIDAFPLRQIESVPNPAKLYAELMELILRFARVGLIHGDFNEFNILIKEERKKEDAPITLVPIVIDFPQMLSITHSNAQFYFDRDVACIKRFFERRFHFTSDEPGPFFDQALQGSNLERRLDVEVEATGFSKKLAKDLEAYIDDMGRQSEQQHDPDTTASNVNDGDENNDDDDDDENTSDDDNEDDDSTSSDRKVEADHDTKENNQQPESQEHTAHQQWDRSMFTPIDLPKGMDEMSFAEHGRKKTAGWAI